MAYMYASESLSCLQLIALPRGGLHYLPSQLDAPAPTARTGSPIPMLVRSSASKVACIHEMSRSAHLHICSKDRSKGHMTDCFVVKALNAYGIRMHEAVH